MGNNRAANIATLIAIIAVVGMLWLLIATHTIHGAPH